jgi:hypothetical protein
MSGELEALLRLVSEGRISADEAAPIVAALEEKARNDARGAGDAAGSVAGAGARAANAREGGREAGRRQGAVQELLADRKLRVYVAENGRQVINIQIPLAAAGFAIDQVPGLSPDHRSRIVEAIQSGMTGPILEVCDDGDEVRIVIE